MNSRHLVDYLFFLCVNPIVPMGELLARKHLEPTKEKVLMLKWLLDFTSHTIITSRISAASETWVDRSIFARGQEGGVGGYSTKFYTGRLGPHPQVQPSYPLKNPIDPTCKIKIQNIFPEKERRCDHSLDPLWAEAHLTAGYE